MPALQHVITKRSKGVSITEKQPSCKKKVCSPEKAIVKKM